ncbi:MAG TPA: endonuclease/exonuclease/phosphatase family protein [Actinomycetota bacterium]
MRAHAGWGLALAAALGAGPAAAVDLPMAGASLKLVAPSAAEGRRIVFRSAVDPALGGPFPDPTLGAELRIFAGNGPGQCRVDVALDPSLWSPIGDDGAARGWRWVDKAAATAGVKKILVKRVAGGGRMLVKLKGGAIPCDLGAAQNLPVAIELAVQDTRWCAAFADQIRNEPGRFKAKNAPAPDACLDRDVTVANLNVLHGFGCAGQCRLPERIDLLADWIALRGCPDVVTLQEVISIDLVEFSIPELVEERVLDVCPHPYEMVFIASNGIDDAIVLSRHPVLDASVTPLLVGFRHVLHARIDHPVGPVDVFTTHLASGSDGATNPCGVSCPAECVMAGATTVRECQAEQTALVVEALHDVPGPAFLTGDMNAEPGDFEIGRFTGRGWIDTYLAAGNAECDGLTGAGCTGGRSEAQMEDPALNVDERIDYVFLVPSAPAGGCADTIDGPGDDDGDGTATRLFADAPNPFAPSCGALPDPICWPADHVGVEADVNCE